MPISISAGYFAATDAWPDGLVLVDKLVADHKSRDRPANSIQAADDSLLIDGLEAINSRRIRLD